MVAAPHRVIEHVPALLVGLLHEVGKVPVAPPPAVPFGYRHPTLADAAKLEWLIEWEGSTLDDRGFRRAAGLAAYRDVYDYHTVSNVRECCYVAGSRRSVVNLLRKINADAKIVGRRFVGSIDSDNAPMRKLLQRMLTETRVTFEDRSS